MSHAFYLGDMRKRCRMYPEGYFTAVVTDPPHNLGDMEGSSVWDTDVAMHADTWKEAFRVLRPGGYLLCFMAPRTQHRLTVAVEDAGFEIADCLLWLHSEGMPKNRNLLKEIDKQYGNALGMTLSLQAWQGWGTSLRPCWTPILLAKKPSTTTYAINAYTQGVAGLAIDRCRIPCTEKKSGRKKEGKRTIFRPMKSVAVDHSTDRHPTNVLLDQGAAKMLDVSTGNFPYPHDFRNLFFDGKHPRFGTTNEEGGYSGGPVSRFFYCHKATPKDRQPYNDHPCVKPTPLMKYLAMLVTYPGDNRILDPFCGSGSTALACRMLEYHGIQVSTVNFDTVPHFLGIGYRRLRDHQPPRLRKYRHAPAPPP